MAVVTSQDNHTDGLMHYASGTLTGTYTAADFTITLGFVPKYIRVINLSDRIQAEHFVDSALDGGSNAKQLLRVAAGTTTYAAAGISVSGKTFTVDVSVASLQTDNDDVFWEARG